MSSKTYTLCPFDGVLSHARLQSYLLHDFDANSENLEIAALVASGDCLDMLASNLDQIAHSAPKDSTMQAQLEQAIQMLIYLQRHYKLVQKPTQNP